MESTQLRKHFSDLKDFDMKMIEGIPWAEKMYAFLSNGLAKAFLNWAQVALKMGKKEEDMQEWIEIFNEHFEETCCDLVSDMEHLQSQVIGNIEKSLEKLQHLCETLQVAMPVFDQGNLSLYQVQRQLKDVIVDYELRVETKRSELDKICKRERDLCHSLGKDIKILRNNALPSEEDMRDYNIYLNNLEQEQFDRYEKFLEIKKDICVITKEVNYKPSTQFEKDVLSSDETSDEPKFLLTDENMRELANFYNTLKKEQENVKEELSELRNKVDDYWNLLDVPLLEREEFNQKYAGWSFDVLDVWRLEVRRCENLKKANIKVFIDKLRQELIQIWDKCHCSDSVRDEFGYFHTDCYTEDLLELHEFELKRWHSYYEKNKEILCLLKRHAKLWKKVIELEKSASNPDRFNNRGGQLLKEEKERNTLSKEIPKIEHDLEKLANTYEMQNGYPFKTYGETVTDYIANLHFEREHTKKEKLSARKREYTLQAVTPTNKSSAQCLFPSSGASKRKLPTPVSVSKKSKASPVKTPRKVKVPTIVVSSVNSSKRHSIERKKRLEKIRRMSTINEKNNAARKADSGSSDYMEFETEISGRQNCRSTINPLTLSPERQLASSSKAQLTPKHFSRRGTPTTSCSPGKNKTNLTAAKSNFKLIF